jgi:predicted  nucleic acid-binding Zn-ribbon protein
MTDSAENLVLVILQDVQAKLSRIEDRLTNMELRFTGFERQVDLVNSRLSSVQDRLDGFQKQLTHINRRLELRDAEQS